MRSAADVYFRISDRGNEFLHCSTNEIETQGKGTVNTNAVNTTNTRTKEINCSLERTSWRLMHFDSPLLQATSTTASSASNAAEPPNDLRCNDIVYLSDPDALAYLRLSKPESSTDKENNEKESEHHSTDAYLEPVVDPQSVDSN